MASSAAPSILAFSVTTSIIFEVQSTSSSPLPSSTFINPSERPFESAPNPVHQTDLSQKSSEGKQFSTGISARARYSNIVSGLGSTSQNSMTPSSGLNNGEGAKPDAGTRQDAGEEFSRNV